MSEEESSSTKYGNLYSYKFYIRPTAHRLYGDRFSTIKKIKWIRLLYTHPAHIYDDLIDVIANNKKVVKDPDSYWGVYREGRPAYGRRPVTGRDIMQDGPFGCHHIGGAICKGCCV